MEGTPEGETGLSVPKIVVHTDVLLGHLNGGRGPSVLRRAMSMVLCYTTVFNAIELLSLAATRAEREVVEEALGAMKVLGLNPKNAPHYGELLAGAPAVSRWNVLIGGLCVESRLPLLTDRASDFRGLRGLQVVSTRAFLRGAPGAGVARSVHDEHRGVR